MLQIGDIQIGDRVDWIAASQGWEGENCEVLEIDYEKGEAKLDWLRHPVPLSQLKRTTSPPPMEIKLIELPPPIPFPTQPIPEVAPQKKKEFTVNISAPVKEPKRKTNPRKPKQEPKPQPTTQPKEEQICLF